MRRTFNRFSLAAFVVTLSLGAVRFAFSDGPSDTTGRIYTGVGAPSASHDEPTSGAPLILNLGPPPTVYSPSADFGARVEAAPGWAVASDDRTAWTTPAHPVVSTLPMMPSCMPQSGPFDTTMPLVATPCYQCPPPMQTAMQPHGMLGAPSYYAPPPSLPFGMETTTVPSPQVYTKYYNPAVVFPSQLAATPTTVPAPRANPVYSSPAAGEADHLDHILQAVHHLEAAGLQADADRLRRECDDKVERLIECLKSNEAELSRLPQSASSAKAAGAQANDHRQMVIAQLYVLDVDVNKLTALKVDSKNNAITQFAKAYGSNRQQGSCQAFEGDATALASAIKSLQDRGIVDVLSRPQIMTLSGQEAVLQVGQSVPQPAMTATGQRCVQESFVGTRASVLPEVIDHENIRMVIDVCFSEPGDPRETHETQTIVQAHSGETVLLGGLCAATDGHARSKLIVICPEIVKSDDVPPPPVAESCASSCTAGPCGEAVHPVSALLEACPTAKACSGTCPCDGACACDDACAVKNTAEAQRKPIFVHVQLLELNRSKMRDLGFDFADLGQAAAPSTCDCQGQCDNPVCPEGCDKAKCGEVARSKVLGNGLLHCLDALRKEGAVKVLSDPSLCTLSGRPASFHCGGEIGIPVKQSDGTTTVQYKKYGTEIDCVSHLLDGDRLRMEIRSRVSSIGQPQLSNPESAVLALTDVYEFDTAAELQSGQSMVIVGPVHQQLCSRFVEETCVPPCLEQFVDCLENYPWAAAIVDALGLQYSKTVKVEDIEEVQCIAIVRAEIGNRSESQPVFKAAAFGCDLGRSEPKAYPGQCTSQAIEALVPLQSSSFAVQPAGCWAPSATSALFERVLIDTPLLPGPVQPALFTTPESLNTRPPINFDFDFQLPMLPPLDLATPANSPLR